MELVKGALRRLSTGLPTYQKLRPTAQKFCNFNTTKNSSNPFPKSKPSLICGQTFPDYDFNKTINNDFSQNYYKQFHTKKFAKDRASLLKTLVIGGAFVGSVTYFLGKATNKVVLGEYDEDLPCYTADDVAKHKTRKAGVWVSYNRGVYDITDYLNKNPEHTLQISAGGPVHRFSTAKENYDADSLEFLEKYRIELIDCANQSTPTSKVNLAVAVGNEDGTVLIKVFDWLSFFKDSKAKKVPHITQYNHFEFNHSNKGKVSCKTDINGNQFSFTIFSTEAGPSGFPAEITPLGMSKERKEYLHKNIRAYCKDEFKDILCPPVTDVDEDSSEPQPGSSCMETTRKRKRSI